MEYQRKHLRAPYKVHFLFEDEGFVYKARTLNISEGGLLLDQMPHFPKEEVVPLLFPIPQFPIFMNFDLEKLQNFSSEIFPDKVIRGKIKCIRRLGETTAVDDVFKSRIGVQFTDIDPFAGRIIGDYVEVFSSNIIHLLRLIEESNSFKRSLKAARYLSDILGYPTQIKISELREIVNHDYRSLQWLNQ